ncbi:cell division protein FtsQ/DivIB [Ottowia pentelensis]|uniref:Cell division protein FtsQ n=1 Tax=Ottowia pentelensis TaxID=511108 RepID=A0ABV6PU03_9BURK
MSSSLALPFDVRLMNFTTAVLVSALLLAGVAAGLWWVLRNPMFTIGQITVTGDTQHISRAGLRASVEPRLAGNFFTLDLGAVQAAFQQVPWVRKATVRREFPNRLAVQLHEYVPVAQWGEGDTHLVDGQGKVFEVSDFDGADSELPTLLGPEGQAPAVLAMYRALEPLLAPLDTTIDSLELEPRGHWHANLASGAAIELGQGAEPVLAERLSQFASTAAEVAARHQRTVADIETADLRHVGGYALRLRGVTTVQAADRRAKR